MVEKGTRSFRVERATSVVKILDVEPPARNANEQRAGDARDESEKDDEDETNLGETRVDASAEDVAEVERLTEAVEDFHPVLRPYH
jgi:hypothetical protein